MTDRATALERAKVCSHRASQAKSANERHHLVFAGMGWTRVASLLEQAAEAERRALASEGAAERAKVGG